MAKPEPTAPSGRHRRRVAWIAVAAFAVALVVTIGLTSRPTAPEGPPGTLVFEDTFERAAIGDGYQQNEPDPGWQAGTWTIEDGRLKAEKIHNAGLWLQRPLPEQVRIEFDARAESDEGDVKAEVFGDGRTHQSGYILIHGGWNNTINTIAREDEHAEERKEDNRCPERDGRKICVERGVDYHWTIERTDGTVRWYLDGALFLTYPDVDPVRGRHFAFNNWEAPVTFDNLRIYDLSK